MRPVKGRIISLLRQVPPLHRAVWKVRQSYHWSRRRLLDDRPVVDGTSLIEQGIIEAKAFAIGKMGSIEAAGLQAYLRRQRARRKRSYPPYVRETLFVNAGVFPPDDATFDRFCAAYLNAVEHCDALVAWNVAGEAEILSRYCPDATLVEIRGLEPFFSARPWSRLLAGKRVLVISPFTETIRRQYTHRTLLWKNPQVLPEFELVTIRAPLSAGLRAPESSNWFEALKRLKAAMNGCQFDIALIGAGAYSLPLAVHARAEHKVAIHMGGSLQLLFGVIGARWEREKAFSALINRHWCRPSQQETPEDVQRVELGCYW